MKNLQYALLEAIFFKIEHSECSIATVRMRFLTKLHEIIFFCKSKSNNEEVWCYTATLPM